MSVRSDGVIDPEMLHLFLPMMESLTKEQLVETWLIAHRSHNRQALYHIFHGLRRFEFDPMDHAGFFTSAILHGFPEIADHILMNTDVDLDTVTVLESSPFTAAVVSGDVNLCRKLLRMGASATLAEDFINGGEQGKPFITTLQMAALEGNVDIVGLLLQEGSPINFNFPSEQTPTIVIKNKRKAMPRTALQAALLRDDQDMAMLLLNFGAKGIGGEYATAVLQNFDAVRYHLEQQGMTIHDTLPHGQTVLEAAIISDLGLAFSIMGNHPSSITSAVLVSVVHVAVWVMSLPASEGVMIDALFVPRSFFKHADGRFDMDDDLSGLALAIAAFNHKPELVRFLLDNGLRPVRCPSRELIGKHVYNINGCAPGRCGEKACFWMRDYRERVGEESVVEMFTMGADLASLNYLFDSGYAPDSACMDMALYNEDQPLERMKLLLRKGATVNDQELDHDALLQSAISRRQDDIVRWLLRNDVDVNLPPGKVNGRTALQAAAETGNSEILDILVNKKADVNAPPAQYAGGTALQLAAAQGYIGVAETLIKWGADVDAPAGENYGRTALEGAAEQNRIDMVEFLLACGAKTTGAWQKQYIRAIKFAERRGNEACAGLLRKHRRWTDRDYGAYGLEDLSEGSGRELGNCRACASEGRRRRILNSC
ncbi:ankyrin repeat-containing domain protein [Nemania sp. FL0031]|nr:ankyrin repeat-containing domain protein [Nemania sp. FL0031]